MGSDVLARFASCGADAGYVITGQRSTNSGCTFEERLANLKVASEIAAKTKTGLADQLDLQERYFYLNESILVPCFRKKKQPGPDGAFFEEHSELKGQYSFRKNWLERWGRPEAMAMMVVESDNMEPEIRKEDVVLSIGRTHPLKKARFMS